MREFLADRYKNIKTASMSSAAVIQGDVINLSIGDVDFTTDEGIIRKAMADALAGHTHYTDPKGDPELLEAIRKYYRNTFGDDVSKNEILVTTSSCLGMSEALMAILNPEDEVIVFSPYFPVYKDQIEQAGGKCVEVCTYDEENYEIDPGRLRKAITDKTKAMIFNNPCNPTGKAYTKKTYETIAEIAKEKDLLVLADEIYTYYMFDPEVPFVPMRSIPGMKERTVTLNSFSKNYLMTGWRIGYMIGPERLIAAMANISDNLVYSAPSISQRAAIAALENTEIAKGYVEVFQERVSYTAERLNNMEYYSVRQPQGTFYLFPDIRKTGLDSVSFCEKAKKEAGVILLPGIAFGKSGEGHVRIACTQSMETLEEAMDRLENLTFKKEEK